MDILGWLIVGLIAGWLAKLVVPGREPGGFLATMAIGLIGSLIGGFVWRVMFNSAGAGGILVAFVGSCILLLLYHAFTNNRSRI